MRLTKKEAQAMGIPTSKGDLPHNQHLFKKRERQEQTKTDRQHREAMFVAACQAHDLPTPVAEYEFHHERKWKFDWLFEGWLALEIEGGMFGKGKQCPVCKRRPVSGHTSIERLKSDMEKYNEAAIMEFVVIRCLPEDVESGAAFALVKRVLQGAGS